MLSHFLQQHGLVLKKQFTEGGRCKGVYLVQKDSRQMILKISNIPSEMEEIKRNIVGYNSMLDLGLKFFAQKLYTISQQRDYSFILMEYLGENFENFMRHDGGVKDYLTLIDCLKYVYVKSLHAPNQTVIANTLDIFCEISRVTKQELVTNYLPKDVNSENVNQAFNFPLKFLAFSCLDFEPDNLFLQHGALKYADPQDKVVGIPVVDIGIIAGMIKDVAKLPGCECGYDILLSFAAEVGQMLGLSHKQSRAFFHLARMLQFLKGVKHFHLKGKNETAAMFALLAQERFQVLCALLHYKS